MSDQPELYFEEDIWEYQWLFGIFNIGWVYIKPRMLFSAKFHRCFKTGAQAVEDNPQSGFPFSSKEGRSSSKWQFEAPEEKLLSFGVLFFKPPTARPREGCTCRLFHDGIVYRGNERHATCVPNVSACATGRSPELTSKSVALLQLRAMGNRSVSWAWSFSPSWTSRSRNRGARREPGSTEALTCSKQERQRDRKCLLPLIELFSRFQCLLKP